jgi:hypothetical protein
MITSRKALFVLTTLSVLAVLNQNCSGSQSVSSERNYAVNTGTIKIEKLMESSYTLGPDTWPYQLLKLSANDGSIAYVQWIPPLSGSHLPAPTVLVTDPYGGIGWSDNSIDQVWANRPNASAGYSYPDVNGPGYVQGVSQNIKYQLIPPEYNIAVWYSLLKNGMGLLIVHGRFYSGGDLSTYVGAVDKGLQFLNQESGIDRSRIGIFGISLGGFEAIYAASAAPSQLKPLYGVAWSPPTDWQAQATFINSPPSAMTNNVQIQSFQNFFEPYLRRMKAVTHGMPGDAGADFSGLRPLGIIPQLKTHFLILHDDWDMLVPSVQSRSFVSLAGDQAEGLWFPHSAPIDYNHFSLDHQQASEGLVTSISYLFTNAYFLRRLIPAQQATPLYAMYSASDINQQFSYFRQQHLAGHDVSSLVPRLIDLCDARLTLIETAGGNTISGPEYVAFILQSYWGADPTTVNSANVKAYLESNGLPP